MRAEEDLLKSGSLDLSVPKDNFVFKVPYPPKSKKRKQKVLDENIYLQRIDGIIERDFFPDLEKIKTQNEYLDAVKSHDFSSLERIHNKYSLQNSPWSIASVNVGNETPCSELVSERKMFLGELNSPSRSEISVDIPDKNKIEYEKGLDSFLSTHTSEDNENFEILLQEQERIHRLKKPWLYREDQYDKNEGTSSLAITYESSSIKDSTKSSKSSQLALQLWDYKDKNYIMFVPDGVELSSEQKLEMAKNRQEIKHDNTRLQIDPFDKPQHKQMVHVAQKQLFMLEGKIGIDGKEVVTETPKVNGWSFVKCPSPSPGVDQSPLMTWGQIEGTPFRLDGSDTPRSSKSGVPVFKIADQPAREKIAHRLAEKACERNRNKRQKALESARRQLILSSPSPMRGQLEKFNLLSPAARKLASAHIRKKMSGRNLSRRIGTPLRLYSPMIVKPKSSPYANSSERRKSTSAGSPKTPLIHDEDDNFENGTADDIKFDSSSTDDEKKKRPQAADFFT